MITSVLNISAKPFNLPVVFTHEGKNPFLHIKNYCSMINFEDNDIVCRHLQLTKADIIKAIRAGELNTFEDIQDETDAATVCGSCAADLETILEEELQKRASGEV